MSLKFFGILVDLLFFLSSSNQVIQKAADVAILNGVVTLILIT